MDIDLELFSGIDIVSPTPKKKAQKKEKAIGATPNTCTTSAGTFSRRIGSGR
jgi:hypothetical protein